MLNPERSDTNIRRYSNNDLKKLLNLSFLNQQGFKISHLIQMTEEEIGEKVKHLNLQSSDSNAHIDGLIVALIEMNESAVNKLIHSATITFGFEKVITEIIFPFLLRIGLMWQTGSINPAQEHFISNIIRQKIITATETLDTLPDSRLPKVVLFLPDNEIHEFALLFYNYALRKRGYTTVYLGQSVPIQDLLRVVEITAANAILGVLTYAINSQATIEGLRQFSKTFDGQVLLSGAAVANLNSTKKIQLFKNLDDLLVLLA